MKKTTKILAIILTLIMIVGVIAPFVSSAKTVDINTTGDEIKPAKLSTAKDVLNSDEKVPEDFVENGPSPNGLSTNEEIQAITSDELITLTKNDNPEKNALLTSYNSFNDRESGSISVQKAIDNGFVLSQKVSFDPNHTGRKDHVAIFGLKPYKVDEFLYSLVLEIYDLSKLSDDGTEVLLVQSKTFSNDYWAFNLGEMTYFDEHFSIKTACFDQKYDDTLALCYILQEGKTDFKKENQLVDFYKMDGNSIKLIKQLHIGDYVQNSEDTFIESHPEHPTGRGNDKLGYYYHHKIALGDFDRDYVDELAIVSSVGAWISEQNIDPSYYTTEAVIIDDPIGENPNKVFDDFVLNKTDKDEDYTYYDMMCESNCAAGDIDGNKADELIVGGGAITGGVSNNFDPSKRRYVFQYFPQDGKGNEGLISVTYDGEKYSFGMLNKYDMAPLLKQSFEWEVVFPPFSIETVDMAGHNQPCTIFFNGSLYNFRDNNMYKDYTYEFFSKNMDREKLLFYYLHIDEVTVGNFTNDEIGRESVAFKIFGYTNGDSTYVKKIGYYIATITLDDSANEYTDNSNTFDVDENGYPIPEYQFTWDYMKQDFPTPEYSILAADIDLDDGMKVQYVGNSYIYTDPQLKGVLQAAPYFKELGDWNTFMGSTDLIYSVSNGTTKGGAENWSTEVGAIAGAGGGVAFQVEVEISAGYTHSNTSEWSKSFTKTVTNTFSACPYDTVVLTRTPIQLYCYKVWDNEKGDWKKKDDGTFDYTVSATKLCPSYFQLTFDDYNEYVDEYNALVKEEQDTNPDATDDPIYLKHIKTDTTQSSDYLELFPLNETGNPSRYRSTPAPGTDFISTDKFSIDTSGGSKSIEFDETTESDNSSSFSNGLHINVTAKVGWEASLCKAEAGGYFDFSYSWEHSSGTIDSNTIGGKGTVVSIDKNNYLPINEQALEKYTFDWQLSRRFVSLTDNEDHKCPVFEYVVTNPVYPGQCPSNVYACADEYNSNIIVTWEKPKDIEGSPTDRICYNIYRKLSDRPKTELECIGTVDTDTYSFSDSLSNLDVYKTYEYYVGCDYGGTSEKYSAVNELPSTITKMPEGQFYYLGDSNNNGYIDIYDSTLIQKHLAELYKGNVYFCQRAGIMKAGEPDIQDATLIQKYLARIETDYTKIIGTKMQYI